MEFGVFIAEGIVCRDFYSAEEAREFIRNHMNSEDGAYVAAVCHDHPDQEGGCCEECDAEETEA